MRNILNVVMVGVVGFLLCNGAAIPAQSNHTLEWGVEVGDEIIYVLEKKELDASFSDQMQGYSFFLDNIDEGENVTARITHLEAIPEFINESRYMPRANCTLLRTNDSEVIADVFPMIAIPAGDWDFTTEMTNLSWSEDSTMVDTADEWGTSLSTKMIFGIFLISFDMDMRYFKDNGTLSLLSFHVKVGGTVMVNIRLVVFRSEPSTTFVVDDSFPIEQLAIYVGVAAVVIIPLVLIIRRRFRRKARLRSEVQPEPKIYSQN